MSALLTPERRARLREHDQALIEMLRDVERQLLLDHVADVDERGIRTGSCAACGTDWRCPARLLADDIGGALGRCLVRLAE